MTNHDLDGLVINHLGLVKHIAREFQRAGLPTWVYLGDLIQAGNMGLVEAARRYDPTRKLKFSTYARDWIKKRIRLAIEFESSRAILDSLHDPDSMVERGVDVRKDDMADELWEAIDNLPEENQHIVVLYYGLTGNPEESIETIALSMGVPWRRVRRKIDESIALLGTYMRQNP